MAALVTDTRTLVRLWKNNAWKKCDYLKFKNDSLYQVLIKTTKKKWTNVVFFKIEKTECC